MKREEAIEVVRKNLPHLGIGATEMTDALRTLIPEFGKTGSDKVIDHEDKYKEALLEARTVLEPYLKYSNGKVREALDSIDKELKSFESDDERIRKLLVWQVYRNIEDETNYLAGCVYDGIKGHDPDLEESIEDWKKCLAWLEKQKEQDWNKKPCLTCQEYEKGHKQGYAEGCTAGYNKAMKEVEQKEQKPDTRDADDLQLLGFIYDLLNEIEWKDNWAMSKDECLRRLNNYRPQKPEEWSEEDKRALNNAIVALSMYANGEIPYLLPSQLLEDVERLKSLRPQYHGDVTMTEAYKMGKEAGEASHWKPSEEQMKALNKAIPVCMGVVGRDAVAPLESLCEQLEKLM